MFRNNKIFILGFARSGYEAAKLLINRGNEVLINDGAKAKDEDLEKIEELKKMGVKFVFGEHPDDLFNSSYDYLIKNPGVPIKHKYVLQARELKVDVINEVEMSYLILKEEKNVDFIAITGTNGKTTTTTLIYEFLKQSYNNIHLAGNIGYPLSSFVNKINDKDIIVTEISCQQLENLDKFNPNVAVLTNISEAHIEFMLTYEHYKYSKSKLFKNHNQDNIAIINKKDKESNLVLKDIKSSKKYFGYDNECMCYLKDNNIYYKDEFIISLSDVKLVGMHNYENIMAAIIAVKEYNVSNDDIVNVLKVFSGVEHRLELVREFNKRKFYNDTEATNIKCTQIALSSFNAPTIVILGGYERNQNFNELSPYLRNVKAIMAIGACRNRVSSFAKDNNIECHECEFLKDAFEKAYNISNENDIILLSPASASWDQYKQCEDRGAEFKKYVEELK